MRIKNRQSITPLVLGVAFALLTTGCASHKFVRTQGEATRTELGEEIDGVVSEVEQTQSRVAELEGDVAEQGEEIAELSQTAQDALDRAIAADKLAQGKFLYETVLASDALTFGFEQASLSDEARTALDEFANELKTRNENVYIEIQGHTDTSGDESYNLILGEQRAESVRRYLSLEHDLPLHRMAVISYGETAPREHNAPREGRERNRRVALVVLQ